MRSRWQKGRNLFRLPMGTTFGTYQREDGRWIAHALDFDLVSSGMSKAKALDKLRISVKTYIEYGLTNNWVEDIIFPAPDRYWERIPIGHAAETMAPIEIEDRRMLVYDVPLTNEPRRTAA